MKLTRARLLFAVIATTLVVAYVPAVVMAVRGVSVEGAAGRALVVFQSFAPLVGALVGQALLPKGPIARPLGLTLDVNAFWIVAWLSPLVVATIGILCAWGLGAEPVLTLADLVRTKRALVAPSDRAAWDAALREHPMQAPYTLLVMALPAGVTINFFPALAAEVGLRGFLYREMPGGYFARALRIGAVQAAISIPVVLMGWGFPDHPTLGAGLMVLSTLLFSLAALYLRARCESVVPVAFFHGTFLALVHPALDLAPHASDLVRPMFGLAGSLGMFVLLLGFAIHDRRFARSKLMFPKKPSTM